MTLTAATLTDLLPQSRDPDSLFEVFADWAGQRGLPLYPHQEEALIEIVSGANVILSTPTGSGKSLVATGAHFAALADGRRTFYTAPIKALVSEKFFGLCDIFGPANVGMLTGDAAVNTDAPIVARPRCWPTSRCAKGSGPTSVRSSWTSSTTTPTPTGAGRGRYP